MVSILHFPNALFDLAQHQIKQELILLHIHIYEGGVRARHLFPMLS